MTQDDEWLTAEEIAAELKISRDTVLRLIDSGDLVAAKVGRQYRIRRSDLNAYLERSK